MHTFWTWTGFFSLVIGLGVLQLAGAIMGVPTFLGLFYPTLMLGASLNLLQGIQTVLTIFGIIALIAGLS